MSKGFIKVCFLFDMYEDKNGSLELQGDHEGVTRNGFFVAKRNVETIQTIVNFEQLRRFVYNEVEGEKKCPVYNILSEIGTVVLKSECTCGFEDNLCALKHDRIDFERHNFTCKCFDSLFPLHIVTVNNKTEQFATREKRDRISFYSYTPTTCMYVVDPSEREHMERFIAGTDDALFDYVHHLQYAPAPSKAGSEVVAAQLDYESAAKKLKI